MTVEVLTRRREVEEFVDTVQTRADVERYALGFLPASAYAEAAAQEKLLVAVTEEGGRRHYAGHVMFGGAFPNGRIYQIYVEPAYRRKGVADKLIGAVVHRCEKEQFLSLKASVADDLEIANHFWERMGFPVALVKRGGISRGRLLNVRVRDLQVPSLLNLLGDTPVQARNDLGLIANLSRRAPLYVIDLNVLFDVVKGRPRSQKAGRVIRAALKNTIRLAVSEEFVEELQRNSRGIENDPILQLVLEFPRLALPDGKQIIGYEGLGHLLFASRYKHNCLTVQDKSDIRHLATVIHHGAAGFVTSESAILRARTEIQEKYGVDIVGLEEFVYFDEPEPMVDVAADSVATKSARIEIRDSQPPDTEPVADFLRGLGVPDEHRNEVLRSQSVEGPRRQLIVTSAEKIIAFGSWNRFLGPQRTPEVFICSDEGHALAETAIDFLLNRACIELSISAPSLLRLQDFPGKTVIRKLAIAQGFRPGEPAATGARVLQKICVGRPVFPDTWPWFREKIRSLSGVNFPEIIPEKTNPAGAVAVTTAKGTTIPIALHDLENLMSPVLLLFDFRYGAIVPIQRWFADELLGTSDQHSLLEFREASLLNERAYICTPRAARALEPGTPLLFYESGTGGGRASVVAVGRSIASDIVLKSEFPDVIERRSVLNERDLRQMTLGDHVLATRFDNVMPLPRPVPFSKLKTLNAVDGANLRTTRTLTGMVFINVVAEGWSNAS